MHSKQPKKYWLPLLLVACLASVAVMLYVLCRPQTTFVPPPFESTAVSGTPENVPETLGYASLDATAYQLALCGAPTVQDGAATLYFTNPAGNTVWLKVRVCTVDGTLLGESGLLRPGEYVENVPLDTLPTEDTPVVLKVMAYELDTYRSAGAVSLSTMLSAAG